MVDIPQHAGQVALLLDLLGNHSQWKDTFYINYFTPYWVGYGAWALLSLILPLTLSLKIILTTTFFLFIFSGKLLRRSCNADERLDWLLIPSFFGFCFNWGFLTFLMAAPAGMFFISYIINFDRKITPIHLVIVFLSGALLFLCHGLIFVMCMTIGGLLAIAQSKSLKTLALRLTPYIALTPILLIYIINSRTNATTANFTYGIDYLWLLNSDRILQFIIFPWGTEESHEIIRYFGVIGLFSPFLVGSALNKNAGHWIPFILILLIWLAVPHFAMKTFFLYERFSLFILPFYILLFIKPTIFQSQITKTSKFLKAVAPWILPGLTILFLALNFSKTLAFARETKDFDNISQKASEGKRVAALIYDRKSIATGSSSIYTHYASWYQAERKGIVDFSFAWFSPQPVRFKSTTLPLIKPGLEWYPDQLNWASHLSYNYDYFFVRGNPKSIDLIIKKNPCSMQKLATSGNWHIYKKTPCNNSQVENNDNT